MIVELDINSEGAMQVPFETATTGATFNGRKARCEFGRIMTPKYEIDKIRLTGYKMPILDILYDLMLKDMGLAVEAAMGIGATIPLGELARNLYAMNRQAGRGGLDFSSVVQLLAQQS